MIKKKLLLHTCCAPCATVPIERLESQYEITCFFFNPNIHPESEYLKRLKALTLLSNELGVKIIAGQYDSAFWFELIKGLENEPEGGKRCAVCFKIRLEKAATVGRDQGFDVFTTTLSISPHKNAILINQIGIELGENYAIQILEANFKKQDGYRRSIVLSKQYNLYRQHYCGCIFSQR